MFLRTTRYIVHQSRLRSNQQQSLRYPSLLVPMVGDSSARSLAVAAVNDQSHQQQQEQQDMIRATIHKLFAEQCGQTSSESMWQSAKAIQQSMQLVKNQMEEARCCILDAKDAQEMPEFEEEIQTAEMAMERAVAAFVDLLDMIREGGNDVAPVNTSNNSTSPPHVAMLRQEHTALIKALRQELQDLRNNKKQQQQ